MEKIAFISVLGKLIELGLEFLVFVVLANLYKVLKEWQQNQK